MNERKVLRCKHEHYDSTNGYYPEDDWELDWEITGPDSLFRFFKQIHRYDSYNRNNPPVNGNIDGTYQFYTRTYFKYGGVEYPKYGTDEDVEYPEYWKEVKIRFHELIQRLKRTTSAIENIRSARKSKEEEYRKYLRLKKKYEARNKLP